MQDQAVEEDVIAGLVRQTMNLDLSELMEQPVSEQRRPRSTPMGSVAGPVDKATLLEAFDSEIQAVEAQAQRGAGVLSVTYEEDVSRWAAALARWFAEQANPQLVSLMKLQQELGIPLVEVWLGLLLSQQPGYRLEQTGEFYDPQGVRAQIS